MNNKEKEDYLSFNERIMRVQQELKAPKGQWNDFGKYKYRSTEDIFKAVKPLLAEYELIMRVSDEVVAVLEDAYVVATVQIYDIRNGYNIESKGWAKLMTSKKGMDTAQMTGACSSYARKYALNGLLLIDDETDPDEQGVNPNGKPEIKPNTQLWTQAITAMSKDSVTIEQIRKKYNISESNAEKLKDDAGV